VLLDLQASQSPTYRERGVARYSLDFARALAAETPDVLDQVLLRADLGPVGGLDALLEQGVLTTKPDWDRPGAVFHVLSPFDLATPVRRIWPRPASAAGMRLVVTVYDLIPELFPEIYLTDPGTRARYRARRELVRAADHVVTLSRSAADDVVAHLGCPRSASAWSAPPARRCSAQPRTPPGTARGPCPGSRAWCTLRRLQRRRRAQKEHRRPARGVCPPA